jgi:hypothetical protein
MKEKRRSKRYRKAGLKRKESHSVALKIERYNRMTDAFTTPEEVPLPSILPKVTSI